MSALLGLLATSVVTAIVGTALKGILRPVSWALLAGTLLLLGSVKVVEATNSVADSNSASNAVGVPAAALGWQSATDGFNPAFSPLYAQQPFSPQPSNPVPSPAASSPAANPNVFAQNPNPPASGSQSAPPARPIQALW